MLSAVHVSDNRRVIYQATEAANRTSHRVSSILPNDTYTVSIQAVLPDGGFTAPGATNATGGFVVPKMIVGAPPKNVTLSLSKVSWNAVNGATRYQVWLSVTNSGGTTRIFKTDVYDTELVIPGELDSYARRGSNEFRVWVRAIRNEDAHESTGRWSVPGLYTLSLDEFAGQRIAAAGDSSILTMVMTELATSALLDTVT